MLEWWEYDVKILICVFPKLSDQWVFTNKSDYRNFLLPSLCTQVILINYRTARVQFPVILHRLFMIVYPAVTVTYVSRIQSQFQYATAYTYQNNWLISASVVSFPLRPNIHQKLSNRKWSTRGTRVFMLFVYLSCFSGLPFWRQSALECVRVDGVDISRK